MRFAVAALLATCIAAAAAAQDWQISRTEWGDPDLEGIWISANPDRLPLQRLAQRAPDAEVLRELVDSGAVEAGLLNEGVPPAPRLEDQRLTVSEWRLKNAGAFSLIVDPPDGRLPPMTDEAKSRAVSAWRSTVLTRGPWNGAADLGPVERCISRGALRSMLPAFDYNGIEIVQAPGVVVVRSEVVHEARIIPLETNDEPSPVRSYMGRSTGRWDGDELVVATAGSNGRTGAHLNGNETPMSERLRLTERFARVGDDVIEYRVTVDDPGTWTAPWTVAFPLTRSADYIWSEYACHEGNYPLRGVLSAARALER